MFGSSGAPNPDLDALHITLVSKLGLDWLYSVLRGVLFLISLKGFPCSSVQAIFFRPL